MTLTTVDAAKTFPVKWCRLTTRHNHSTKPYGILVYKDRLNNGDIILEYAGTVHCPKLLQQIQQHKIHLSCTTEFETLCSRS
jgi:hypothetical protein